MGWKVVGLGAACGLLLVGFLSGRATRKPSVTAPAHARADDERATANLSPPPQLVRAAAPLAAGPSLSARASQTPQAQPLRPARPEAVDDALDSPPAPPVSEQMMTRIAGLNGATQVDRFLGDLEAQAAAKRAVTAAEVEPGLMAIRSLHASLGADEVIRKEIAFGQRMQSLQEGFQANR